MSVGKASIKRVSGAQATEKSQKETKIETVKAVQTKTAVALEEKKSAAKKPAAKKTAEKKPVAKKSAEKTVDTPVIEEKKTAPKAANGAVSLTEEMPYYLL